MNNPINPDHFYVPREENDPVRDEIHRIYREAFEKVSGVAHLTHEQIRVTVEDTIDQLLKESFTSVHAEPMVQVLLTTSNNWPVYQIGSIVYGHTFPATMS